MAVLHTETLGAAEGPAWVFIHGILGTAANLRTLAKQVIMAHPQLRVVLVDLRAHGRSAEVDAGAGNDTVQQAAADVLQTLAGTQLVGALGHSFGGKVAMLMAQQSPALRQLVILDSVPGVRIDARGSELTVQVIQLLEQTPGPWPTRAAFVHQMRVHGLTEGVAMWLAMNLRLVSDQFVLGISLARIRALLTSYLSTDAWPVLEETAIRQGPARWLFLNGATSSVFTGEDLQRLESLAARSAGSIDVRALPTGHWVHAEDPEGTRREVLAWLASSP